MQRHDLLERALRRTFETEMMDDEISSMTDFILSFFGYNDYILDNFLESKDRNIFYMLEDEGLLKVRKEEIFIKVGRLWRINYWYLDMNAVRKRAEDIVPVDPTPYEDLYQSFWSAQQAEMAQYAQR